MTNDETLDLFLLIEDIKTIKRKGWVKKGIIEPESVSDHSFLVSILSLIVGIDKDVDLEKLLIMCIIHDLPEIIVGDITPHCGLTINEKFDIEEKGAICLFQKFKKGNLFIDIWREYSVGETIESKLARSIDKLEMVLQAVKYKNKYSQIEFSEFFSSAKNSCTHNYIKDLILDLEKRYLSVA